MKIIDPGHVYEVHNHESEESQTISFIKKEQAEDGSFAAVGQGTTNEELLRVLADRLSFLLKKLPDPYTKTAKYFVGQALALLEERTLDRKERKVEGTPNA
jgi:hypothetical protein